MRKNNFLVLLLLFAAALRAASLTPAPQRRTDATQRADQKTLGAVATRVAALPADSTVRPAAAAWLLVAQTEYDLGNATPFVTSSLARAEQALAPDAPAESALSVQRAWIAHRRATAGFRAALPLLAAAEALETSATPARAKPEKPDARAAHLPARLRDLQSRLAALWDAGLSAESYAFAKAQHWLDFAADESHARDRSGIVATAAAEAEKIVIALESPSSAPPPALDEKPFSSAPRVRPDLWSRAAALRPADLASRLTTRDPQLASLARLEVQLVWAGHEHAQRGWRSSRSFVQLAERHASAAASLSAP
jgi:hypothetical protein